MTDLPTPALLLDLDALEHNIATMIDMAAGAGIGLRPHGKSHKSPQIARILTEMGANGTCCATLAELEGFAAEDLPGLLLTAPIATAEQIARLGKLHASGADVMVVAIIMTSVPLALVGSVAALWLAGQPLSVAPMVGFITLTGIGLTKK